MFRILIIICFLFVGCSKSEPTIKEISDIKANIILPNGRKLTAGRAVFKPLYTEEDLSLADKKVLVPFSTDVEKDGTLTIASAYPVKYKVFVIVRGKYRSLEKYIPERYREMSDDETDLFLDLSDTSSGVVLLRMNK